MARSGSSFAGASPAPAAYFQLYPPPTRGGKIWQSEFSASRVSRGRRSVSATAFGGGVPLRALASASSRRRLRAARARRRASASERPRAPDPSGRLRGSSVDGGDGRARADSRRRPPTAGGPDRGARGAGRAPSQHERRCLAADLGQALDDIERRNAPDAAIDVEDPVSPGRIARSQAAWPPPARRGRPARPRRAAPPATMTSSICAIARWTIRSASSSAREPRARARGTRP